MSDRYEQPRAPEAPPKYATPFEVAIYEYEKRAYAHFKAESDCAPPNESEATRKKRVAEWEAAREHLRRERLRLTSLARLQAELAEYRNQASSMSQLQMLEEVHHPTKELVKNLIADDEPQPSPEHVAHHICPGRGRWQQRDILDVRLRMHGFGIRINDSLNGAWLPDKKKSAPHCTNPEAPAHKDIHRFNYETWIINTFPPNIKSDAFKNRLSVIKRQLLDGTYPQKIVQKKRS